MNAGMLREPVTFREQVETAIGGGATDVSLVDKFDTIGFMKPLSGNERMFSHRLDAVTRNRLTIRYRTDIVESDTVVIRNRSYQIRFINNLEFKNRWLELDLDGGVAL